MRLVRRQKEKGKRGRSPYCGFLEKEQKGQDKGVWGWKQFQQALKHGVVPSCLVPSPG